MQPVADAELNAGETVADAIARWNTRRTPNAAALAQPPSPTFLAENAQNSLTAADAGEVRTYREGVEDSAKVAEMWDHRGDIAAAIRKLP